MQRVTFDSLVCSDSQGRTWLINQLCTIKQKIKYNEDDNKKQRIYLRSINNLNHKVKVHLKIICLCIKSNSNGTVIKISSLVIFEHRNNVVITWAKLHRIDIGTSFIYKLLGYVN